MEYLFNKIIIFMNKSYITNDADILKIKKENYPSVTSEIIKLSKKNFSIEDLKFIIIHFPVSIKEIIRTQYLTPEFCKEFLLNNNNYYSRSDSDNDITLDDILYYQEHLSEHDFR